MDSTHQSSTLTDARLADVNIERPLVSIVVTSYNYARYITHCLDSLLAQTYTRWECIVVDDVSTDGTAEIMRDYLVRHGAKYDIRFIRRETNGGQMEAFRDGLALAKGTFVMMLDADDVLLPDFLQAHIAVHLGKKAVAFTSSNQYQINENGEIICGDHPDHLGKGSYRYTPQQVFQKTFWIWATASSMVFRRATLTLIMPGPEITFRICADYYFAHFCQQVGNSILIPGVYGCYRRHEENNFSSNPLVGAINSLGDVTKHPPHTNFRRAMAAHVIANFDRFLPIFGHWGILVMLFRLTTFSEMAEILRKHRALFAVCKGNLMWRYVRFHLARYCYDRSPWEARLMIIDPPQLAFVPPPPTPGKIVSAALRRRLTGLWLKRG